MICPHCAVPTPKKRAKKTKLDYATFFCPQCKHIFNERTGPLLTASNFPQTWFSSLSSGDYAINDELDKRETMTFFGILDHRYAHLRDFAPLVLRTLQFDSPRAIIPCCKGWQPSVLATQDICSQKRRLKGGVVVVEQALFERMAHVASTGRDENLGGAASVGQPGDCLLQHGKRLYEYWVSNTRSVYPTIPGPPHT